MSISQFGRCYNCRKLLHVTQETVRVHECPECGSNRWINRVGRVSLVERFYAMRWYFRDFLAFNSGWKWYRHPFDCVKAAYLGFSM